MDFNRRSECLNIYNSLPSELLQKGERKTLEKGSFLYRKGDKPTGFYFIIKGLMALIDTNPNGHESLLRVHSENFFIGHRTFLVEESYHASSLCLENTEVVHINLKDIRDLQSLYPEVLIHITQMLARDLRFAEERFNDLSGKRVLSRIIDSILFLKHRKPGYPWTRREVGEFCGATTETVTRHLSKLEKLNLVKKDGRLVIIPDVSALLEYKNQTELES